MPRAPDTLATIWPVAEPRTLTGAVEMRLAEAAAGTSRPAQVGAVLCAVYGRLDGQAATPALVARLSTGARAWLLARAVALAGRESGWFQADCSRCGSVYDFPLRLGSLPRGMAGAGFPVAVVSTTRGPRRFECPNGGHEERLAATSGPDPRRDLVALLALDDGAAADAAAYTEADLTAIEAALDAVAPDVADRISATCPACGHATEAEVDPLPMVLPRADEVLRDTHLIARAYGWGERAIHALPSPRRRAYAQIIRSEGAQRGRG